jgi:hypothetical protein
MREMLLQDLNIQSLLSGEAEIKKISGDDEEEEEEENDEGVTTVGSGESIINTLGEISFPGIRYYAQTSITQFSNVMNAVNSSTDSNAIKKRGYKRIINFLEEKKKDDKKNLTVKAPDSKGYKTAKRNLDKAEYFIGIATQYMDDLNIEKEEPKKEAAKESKHISPKLLRRTQRNTTDKY